MYSKSQVAPSGFSLRSMGKFSDDARLSTVSLISLHLRLSLKNRRGPINSEVYGTPVLF